MDVFYAHEALPGDLIKSLFLAGPTPRDALTPSWRPVALHLLEEMGYDGCVLIPEPRDGNWQRDYNSQIEWEEAALNMADCIVFWVPRDLESMPAFTTNDEWGAWKASGKVVFGAPPEAEKVRYQEYYANKLGVPSATTLEDTLQLALDHIGEGAFRAAEGADIPIHVWRQPSFQAWYEALHDAGNKMPEAKVVWSFRDFFWVVQAKIYITAEDRYKDAEFVIGRPDISSVVLWCPARTLADTEVVLVKEFRHAGRSKDGFVLEPPSGSSKTTTDPLQVAVDEVREETSYEIEPERLKGLGSRQLYATLSSVHCHTYAAEITKDELAYFKAQASVVHGENDEERTYVEVLTLDEVILSKRTDWSTLGMIFAAMYSAMR